MFVTDGLAHGQLVFMLILTHHLHGICMFGSDEDKKCQDSTFGSECSSII
jgi:hypothetical protein